MIRADRIAVAVLLAGALAGCSRMGLSDGPSYGSRPAPATYEPLPAVPTAPVTQATLQPLPPPPGGVQAPVDPNAPPPVPGQPAAAPAAPVAPIAAPDVSKAPAIGRTDLLGGWRMASGSDNCQLFMNLTSWAGGYRATTRGCNTLELQKISAWNLEGKTVTLKGSDGSTVATLVNAGGEKFAGKTATAQGISLSR